MNKLGIKHSISCNCVLSQYRYAESPPKFSFVVFSTMIGDVVDIKYVQCPNCGIVHKIIDLCQSEIIQNKEDLRSVVTIDDLRNTLPGNLVQILDSNKVLSPSFWEHAKFIIDNEIWGDVIVLSTEPDEDVTHVKYLQILGSNLFKVDVIPREEYVK